MFMGVTKAPSDEGAVSGTLTEGGKKVTIRTVPSFRRLAAPPSSSEEGLLM